MRRSGLTSLVALLALAAVPASAGPRRPVRSMVELRRERVVPQGWDLSCAAAALSTLLTFAHGDPVSEAEIVNGLLAHANPERIRTQGGFTLLDLKRYATARGYAPEGYANLSLRTLLPLAPAIVPTHIGGEPHFVVFRGMDDGRVVVADPSYGNRTFRRADFEKLWTPRVAFVVRRGPGGPTSVAAGGRPEAPLVPPSVLRGVARGAP